MPQHNYWKLYQLPRIIILTNINFQKDFKIHRTDGRWSLITIKVKRKHLTLTFAETWQATFLKSHPHPKCSFYILVNKNKFTVQRKMSEVYDNEVPSTYKFHIMLWQKTSIQNNSVFSGEPKIKQSVRNNLVPGEFPLPQFSWLVTGLSPCSVYWICGEKGSKQPLFLVYSSFHLSVSFH